MTHAAHLRAVPHEARPTAIVRRTARVRPCERPLLGPFLHRLYALRSRRLRQCIRWLVGRTEGGTPFSVTLRRIFRTYHGVDVGLFTHGGWDLPFHLDEGTTVGRYCSIAETARVITHNHPVDRRSTSGLFFHPWFGLTDEPVAHGRVTIGNDVWIGHNAVVMPSAATIGDGAVIGAGAVVTRDVPPYAIVVGHPARVVGYRFSEATIAALLASRWWEQPLEQLCADLDAFRQRVEPRQ